MLNFTPTSNTKVRMEGSKILSIPFTLWDGVHMGVGVNVCVCTCVETRVQNWCDSTITDHLMFWNQGLSWCSAPQLG